MAQKPQTTLTKKRQTELKRQYRTGEAVGKAIIRFFVEVETSQDEENFKPTLNTEELHFLESTIEANGPNREEFTRYYNYFNILKGQEHWVNYYTQRYYRGFFKILSIIQAAGNSLENLTLLENLLPQDNEETQKLIKLSKDKYLFDLKAISDLLVRNLKLHVIFSFGNLYLYYVILKEIKDKWKLDITAIIPNMNNYKNEFFQLQELAQKLKENIEHHEKGNTTEAIEETLSALKLFCDITQEQIIPNEEEQEFHRNKITELMNFRLDMILNSSFDTNKEAFNL